MRWRGRHSWSCRNETAPRAACSMVCTLLSASTRASALLKVLVKSQQDFSPKEMLDLGAAVAHDSFGTFPYSSAARG